MLLCSIRSVLRLAGFFPKSQPACVYHWLSSALPCSVCFPPHWCFFFLRVLFHQAFLTSARSPAKQPVGGQPAAFARSFPPGRSTFCQRKVNGPAPAPRLRAGTWPFGTTLPTAPHPEPQTRIQFSFFSMERQNHRKSRTPSLALPLLLCSGGGVEVCCGDVSQSSGAFFCR